MDFVGQTFAYQRRWLQWDDTKDAALKRCLCPATYHPCSALNLWAVPRMWQSPPPGRKSRKQCTCRELFARLSKLDCTRIEEITLTQPIKVFWYGGYCACMYILQTHRQFCERRIGSLSAKGILLEVKKLQGHCGESLTWWRIHQDILATHVKKHTSYDLWLPIATWWHDYLQLWQMRAVLWYSRNLTMAVLL